MKNWAAFATILLLLTEALIWSQVTEPEAAVGPEPIVNLIADSQHELTRLPVAFAPLPDSDEIEIGKELEQQYLGLLQSQGEEDPALENHVQKYVEKVGARVAAHAHRKLPYRFHYVPQFSFVNAFALPGGAVFIGNGLMSLMKNEDELAAVLGHEIEHVDHYHCAERVQIEAALRHTTLGLLAGIPVEIFVAGYSKSQEMEADREGTKLAAAAGYSPQGAIEMFEAFEHYEPHKRVRAETPADEIAGIASDALDGYFRSHPLSEERIDQIKKLIASGALPDRQDTAPLKVAYVFLTENAFRWLQKAELAPYPGLSAKEKREREAERKTQYQEAAKLAAQSLALAANQPRAMEIIALADFGLNDFAGTSEMYRKLLPQFPTFADDIRNYVDTFAESAFKAERYGDAVKTASYSLELQPNEKEALRIVAQAQFALGNYRDGDDAVRKLRNMYPDTAEEALAYLNRLTAAQFEQGRYQDAMNSAGESLALQPNQRETLLILANSEFALANFSAAAPVYRKLLDSDALDLAVLRSYADALAGTAPNLATVRDFEAWAAKINAHSEVLSAEMRIETAGLYLMQGDETRTKAIWEQARSNQGVIAPELLARLAWWYYRAGKYDAAAAVLRDGMQMRPGDSGLQLMQAWIDLEQHRFEEAIPLFTSATADPAWNSPVMGMAIASWQAHHDEEALERFDSAAKTLPQWRNPQWVSALYSPGVAQTAAEMDAEWQKRQSAKARSLPKH